MNIAKDSDKNTLFICRNGKLFNVIEKYFKKELEIYSPTEFVNYESKSKYNNPKKVVFKLKNNKSLTLYKLELKQYEEYNIGKFKKLVNDNDLIIIDEIQDSGYYEFDVLLKKVLKDKKQIMDKYDSIKSEKIKLEEEYTHKLNDLSEKLKMRDSEKDELIACNEAFDILKEEKKYILNLLLRVTPNPNLIQQIIDINKEIIQLERKKISIINNKNNNPKVNLLLPKIDEQINIFKNHLSSLEDELINVDLGSSRSNIDNSISSSVL